MEGLSDTPRPKAPYFLGSAHLGGSDDLGAPDVQFVWDQEDGKNEAQDRYQRLGIEGHDWQILRVF